MGADVCVDRSDPRWCALGIRIAQELAKVLRLRFRVAAIGEGREPDAIEAASLPPDLRPHASLPGKRRYFTYEWTCKTCQAPVYHARRLLHRGHEIVRGKILQQGVEEGWRPSIAVVVTAPQRLRASYGITIGVTAPPLEPRDVADMTRLVLLPLSGPIEQGFLDGLRRGAPETLDEIGIASGIASAAALVQEMWTVLDRHAYDPEDREAEEYADQVLHAKGEQMAAAGALPPDILGRLPVPR